MAAARPVGCCVRARRRLPTIEEAAMHTMRAMPARIDRSLPQSCVETRRHGGVRVARWIREMELRERSSKSLLANVLDLDDDYRMFHAGGRSGVSADQYAAAGLDGRRAGTCRRHRPPPPVRLCVDGGAEAVSGAADGVPGVHGGGGGAGTPAVCLLRSILAELRAVTTKLRQDERFEDECSDWKFAAMVVDRLCLCLFTMFTVVSTFSILFSAPHVLVD